MFAKLFGPDDDQVLVKLDEGENGPEVRFFCEPPGLGVCSIAVQFTESDSAWNKAKAYFNDIDETKAIGTARRFKRELIGQFNEFKEASISTGD
ncbi:hypothetical protein PL263_05080 [Methylomonas sp. EFPC3]|uniref:hypothetical protein n=1 Tax=Methylomonas sp. EFPC3 TaxID=3021710 RepID=UPI002417D8C0|nr:hypothetical protein [Methylomonas sp. EFPC3]WFP51403.1 hypothetical protein PL263_05080 [Methylomonas sp. EFPC3]